MHVGVFTVRDLSIAGGSLIRIVGVTQHLSAMGCDVTLFAPNVALQLENKVRFVPLEGPCLRHSLSNLYAAHPRLLSPLRWLPHDRALAALISAHDIDILHAHQHPAGFRLLKIANRIEIPMTMDVHGILKLQEEDHRVGATNPLYVSSLLRMERNLFRRVDALTVRTEEERTYIRRHFGVKEDRVYVIPDAADVEFLSTPATPVELRALRTELGFDGKRIILFGGEFKSQSGLLDLVESYRLLAVRRPEIALLLVGDGVLMPEIEALIQRAELHNIILAGRQSRERFRLYQQLADVVVTPEPASIYNVLATPLKLFDCLASGRPTVATRIASHVSVIQDGVNGYLVEPSDPMDMAHGLERALDAGPESTVGNAGRETVVRDHSWRSSAAAAVSAYTRILSHAGRTQLDRGR